jgi:hypothetical protein
MSNHSVSEASESSNLSNRNVTFSTIEFHEHAMILGDNPSTSSDGPSLEIDWVETGSPSIFDLNKYEILRPPRRVKDQLHMPGSVREEV